MNGDDNNNDPEREKEYAYNDYCKQIKVQYMTQ